MISYRLTRVRTELRNIESWKLSRCFSFFIIISFYLDDFPCDALPSFDDTSLDELDRLSDVAKMNLEFSETSSMASDVSSSERIKFQASHFDSEEVGELDTTSEEENAVSYTHLTLPTIYSV